MADDVTFFLPVLLQSLLLVTTCLTPPDMAIRFLGTWAFWAAVLSRLAPSDCFLLYLSSPPKRQMIRNMQCVCAWPAAIARRRGERIASSSSLQEYGITLRFTSPRSAERQRRERERDVNFPCPSTRVIYCFEAHEISFAIPAFPPSPPFVIPTDCMCVCLTRNTLTVIYMRLGGGPGLGSMSRPSSSITVLEARMGKELLRVKQIHSLAYSNLMLSLG